MKRLSNPLRSDVWKVITVQLSRMAKRSVMYINVIISHSHVSKPHALNLMTQGSGKTYTITGIMFIETVYPWANK